MVGNLGNIGNKNYVAVIGDIVDSRNIKNREEVQLILKDTLSLINEKYQEDIASKFIITLGDEFQGLLSDGARVINIINEIEDKIYPVRLRFGIGIGSISTEINPVLSLGADGPAYHIARDMIENLKKSEKRTKVGNQNIMISTQDNNTDIIRLLNTLFLMCSTLKSKWSDRQREIISAYKESDFSQIKAAQKLGIKQSSVNKGLINAGYYSFQNALETAASTLPNIGMW